MDVSKEIEDLKKRLSQLEQKQSKSNLFEKPQQTVGNTSTDLVLKTLGSVKVQFGNKFVDIFKNGKVQTETVKNTSFIFEVSSLEEATADGIYIVQEGEEPQIYLVFGETTFPLTTDSNTYVSFLKPQETTSDQKRQALINVGFLYPDLNEYYNNNGIQNGLVFIEGTSKLYIASNGGLKEFELDIPSELVLKVLTVDTIHIGETTITESGIDSDIFNIGALEYRHGNLTTPGKIICNSISSPNASLSKGFQIVTESDGTTSLYIDSVVSRSVDDFLFEYPKAQFQSKPEEILLKYLKDNGTFISTLKNYKLKPDYSTSTGTITETPEENIEEEITSITDPITVQKGVTNGQIFVKQVETKTVTNKETNITTYQKVFDCKFWVNSYIDSDKNISLRVISCKVIFETPIDEEAYAITKVSNVSSYLLEDIRNPKTIDCAIQPKITSSLYYATLEGDKLIPTHHHVPPTIDGETEFPEITLFNPELWKRSSLEPIELYLAFIIQEWIKGGESIQDQLGRMKTIYSDKKWLIENSPMSLQNINFFPLSVVTEIQSNMMSIKIPLQIQAYYDGYQIVGTIDCRIYHYVYANSSGTDIYLVSGPQDLKEYSIIQALPKVIIEQVNLMYNSSKSDLDSFLVEGTPTDMNVKKLNLFNIK